MVQDQYVLAVAAVAPRPRSDRRWPSLPERALQLHHRPLTARRAQWTSIALVPLESREQAPALIAGLGVRGDAVQRAALARVQPGLDLWQPRSGRGRPRVSLLEYVWSRPAHRQAYYETQYTLSGPAMRHLWERGNVCQFVGIEVLSELRDAGPGADWDVVHLTSFTPANLLRMLGWKREFEAFAREAGYQSLAAVTAEWRRQREIEKCYARAVR